MPQRDTSTPGKAVMRGCDRAMQILTTKTPGVSRRTRAWLAIIEMMKASLDDIEARIVRMERKQAKVKA